jgi:antibiotic biosynthesis monooxygenase (ABM) superfamily enzyme
VFDGVAAIFKLVKMVTCMLLQFLMIPVFASILNRLLKRFEKKGFNSL